MIIVEAIEEIKKICKSSRDGRVIVPTMGALHEGHVALLDKAREFDQVIATLFINPYDFAVVRLDFKNIKPLFNIKLLGVFQNVYEKECWSDILYFQDSVSSFLL